ncbi:MAG: hypothetical protein RL147_156, partial [Actinomycetota bacterium]
MGSTLFSPQQATAADLGVGLRVIPKSSASSQISGNTKLWFVVKQNDVTTRELVVSGSDSMDQLVKLSLAKLQRIDGEPAISNDESEITPWVEFSENNFILKKNQSKTITMKIAPPTDSKSGSYEAYLIVNASDPSAYKSSGKVTEAVINNSARVAQPVFVGVGDYEDFIVNFEIVDVDGIKNFQDKFLRVLLENKGRTPISPSGQLQLKNMDFEQGTLGPFPFYSATISPDSKAFIDVPIPSSVNPGNWKIFVSASQGNVTETREFEKNLTFTNRFNFLGAAIRIIALVLGLVLALWAYRTLRPQGNRVTRLSPIAKRFRRNKNRMADKEIQDLIARLREKAYAAELKASRLQKSTAKKSATKKATTKKATTKKATTKKATTKKATTKKATTKKATTKKATTK